MFSLAGIGIGTTIGAGVVTVTGQAVGVTGRSAWVAYLIAILWGAFTCLPAFFASATFKIKGGNYSIVAGMLGSKVGAIYSCVYIAMALNFATFCVGCAGYVQSLVPSANPTIVALVVLLVFYVLNLLGLNIFAKVQNVLMVLLLMALLFFGFYGLPKVSPETFAFSQEGFLMNGFSGLIQAVSMFVFSTIAYSSLVNFSANAQEPKKMFQKQWSLHLLPLPSYIP